MNRALQYLNLLGVLALAGLCTLQWRDNGRLNQQVADLEGQTRDQATKLADQDRKIKGDLADLDSFRKRLDDSDSALKTAQAKIKSDDEEHGRLVSELNQQKDIVAKWSAAVAQRDQILRQQDQVLKSENAQFQKLVAAKKDVDDRYTDLVNKYNSIVDDLNRARAKS